MDKGRQIDHNQNVNARFIDNFGTSQKTSVKIANPPGGKSSFSLGWDNNAEVVKPSKKKAVEQNNNNNQEDPWSTSSTYGNAKKKPVENYGNNFTNQNVKNVYNPNEGELKEKTSVKVKYAPGGKSNFSLGYENTNYDDFRKNI